MDTRPIDSRFMVVPCRNVYKYILGHFFVETLDAVASSVHLKLKCHNVKDEPMTISTNISRAKRFYKALQHDQKEGEGKVMEINVASLFE